MYDCAVAADVPRTARGPVREDDAVPPFQVNVHRLRRFLDRVFELVRLTPRS